MIPTKRNGPDAGNDRPAKTLTKHAVNCIDLTDLQLDDLLARHPALRREIERAYRAGHVEGWSAAVDALFDYGGDGTVIHEFDDDHHVVDWTVSPDQINGFSHLLCAWHNALDDEPVPPHGSAWEPSPITKDGGLVGFCESNPGDDHE